MEELNRAFREVAIRTLGPGEEKYRFGFEQPAWLTEKQPPPLAGYAMLAAVGLFALLVLFNQTVLLLENLHVLAK